MVYAQFGGISGSNDENVSNTIQTYKPFNTIVDRSNGDWNGVTGIFTCRTPGIYKFSEQYNIKQTRNNTIVPQVSFTCWVLTSSNFNPPIINGQNPVIPISVNNTSYIGQQNSGYATRPGSLTVYARYGDTFSFYKSTNANQFYFMEQGVVSWVSIQQLA
jgi:hypothetical protein